MRHQGVRNEHLANCARNAPNAPPYPSQSRTPTRAPQAVNGNRPIIARFLKQNQPISVCPLHLYPAPIVRNHQSTMIRRCKKAGLAEPEIRIDGGFFVLTIQRGKPEPGTQSRAQSRAQSGPGRHQVGTMLALSGHQVEILRKCLIISPIGDLMEIAERTDRTKFRNQVLKPLLDEGLIQMTIPDKPKSSKQRYQTTQKGRALLEQLGEGEGQI